ncbi:hypothetical protein [Rothia sp. HMSC065C12]|uniref:hypothetical protein n=1 Tax=Rothia sp. HMSC065C12 TaxID=1739340 RepID=UPI001438EC13|nr:hypothetical protein [Rothia sp. HMSC065C12]
MGSIVERWAKTRPAAGHALPWTPAPNPLESCPDPEPNPALILSQNRPGTASVPPNP